MGTDWIDIKTELAESDGETPENYRESSDSPEAIALAQKLSTEYMVVHNLTDYDIGVDEDHLIQASDKDFFKDKGELPADEPLISHQSGLYEHESNDPIEFADGPLPAKSRHRYGNLKGRRFGHLYVVYERHYPGTDGQRIYRCTCSGCQERVSDPQWEIGPNDIFYDARESDLIEGRTTTCGGRCGIPKVEMTGTALDRAIKSQLGFQFGLPKHGRAGMPEYTVWKNMLSKIRNSNTTGYIGDKVGVAKRWLKFENFFRDMGIRPNPKSRLARIRKSVNFCGSNCFWTNSNTKA